MALEVRRPRRHRRVSMWLGALGVLLLPLGVAACSQAQTGASTRPNATSSATATAIQQLAAIKSDLLQPGFHQETLLDNTTHFYFTNSSGTIVEVPQWNNYKMEAQSYTTLDGHQYTRLAYMDTTTDETVACYMPNVELVNAQRIAEPTYQGAIVAANPAEAAQWQKENAQSLDNFKLVIPLGNADVPQTDAVVVTISNLNGGDEISVTVTRPDETQPTYQLPVYTLFGRELLYHDTSFSRDVFGHTQDLISDPHFGVKGFDQDQITISNLPDYLIYTGMLNPVAPINGFTGVTVGEGTEIAKLQLQTQGNELQGLRIGIGNANGYGVSLSTDHLATIGGTITPTTDSIPTTTIPGLNGLTIYNAPVVLFA